MLGNAIIDGWMELDICDIIFTGAKMESLIFFF